MTSAIFLDANIPTYAVGRPHPLKEPCLLVLGLVAEQPRRFFTDVEVFQELLHRYLALHFWPQGKGVIQRFGRLMEGRVVPITWEDIHKAVEFADLYSGPSARDLLHLAVMTRLGCRRTVSADRDFDRFPEVQRLDPLEIGTWRAEL